MILYKIRFALKQERFDNLGQWKYNDATNKEWSKKALSWPVKEDGNLNEVNYMYLHFSFPSLKSTICISFLAYNQFGFEFYRIMIGLWKGFF